MIFGQIEKCKFCGGEAKVQHIGTNLGERYRVKCTKCNTSSDMVPSSNMAIELWNRRYSGLNDKNGKPICEGDHIKITGENLPDSIRGRFMVLYSDVGFTWGLKRVDNAGYYSQVISFGYMNIIHFTDNIELVHKEK